MLNQYSLVYQEEEREMFPTLKVRPSTFDAKVYLADAALRRGLHPLARGLLTRPMIEKSKRGNTDWFLPQYKGTGTPGIVERSSTHHSAS